MARKRCKPEEIVSLLRQAEASARPGLVDGGGITYRLGGMVAVGRYGNSVGPAARGALLCLMLPSILQSPLERSA